MPVNLTGSTIASTFDQILHVDDGPTATEKTVYSGTGVATALKVGTESVSVENVQIDGNTIRTLDTNGNLVLAPNGNGVVSIARAAVTGGTVTGITDLAIADGGTGASTASGARTNLELGTIATQNANNVAITGGSITNVVFTGSFSGITAIDSTTFTTSNLTTGVTLTDNTLSADGTDANIDINLTPKGTGEVNLPKVDIDAGAIDGTAIGAVVPSTGVFTQVDVDNLRLDGSTLSSTNTNGDINLTPNGVGEVNVTNIDVLSGKVPFATITNRAYGQFYSTQDQTAAADTATAVTFNNSDALNTGVTVLSNSRITFAAAGDYDVYFSIQLLNAENADHEVTFWLKLNGTDVANSATRIVVPASGVGGTGFFAFNTIIRVTAGQYVEVFWATEDVDVSLNYEAAQTTPFARPAIPSAVLTANRIG
jgi:hypothetical protein